MGQLTLLLSVLVFLEIGGAGATASALARSYEAVPIAANVVPAKGGALVGLVVLASAQILESAVALAAPALVVALLLADLALGVVARMAPQVPVYFVGMPLKSLAGVGVVLLALGAIESALITGFRGWAALLERGVALWR
jgi:flagellar biosynthetic protein FliR